MALQDMLSAMRSIILDPLDIPERAEERASYYKAQFPKLSQTELEDLAKIEPSKFGIYTQSIFAAERGILRNHFPITHARLAEAWSDTHGEELTGIDFVRKMHVARPWRSSTTHSLGVNFVAHLGEDHPELLETAPELPELARFELLTLEIKRHLDEEEAGIERLTKADLASLSVESLLESSFTVSSSCRFFESDRDVVGTYLRFRSEGGYQAPALERTTAVGSRDSQNYIRWQKLDGGLFRFLSGVSAGKPRPVAELAENIVMSMDSSQPEEALFLGFLEKMMGLIDTGVLVVPRQSAEAAS